MSNLVGKTLEVGDKVWHKCANLNDAEKAGFVFAAVFFGVRV